MATVNLVHLAAAAALLAAASFWSVGTTGEGKPSSAVKPVPAVQEVTVEPTGKEGTVRLKIKIDSKKVLLPKMVRTELGLQVRDGVITREVSLGLSQIRSWEKKYLEDLKAVAKVVAPGPLGSFPSFAAAPQKVSDQPPDPEAVFTLPVYQGVPKLASAEEQKIIDHCLMIRHLGVVEDSERTGKGGAWTFGRIMKEIANEPATGIKPAVLVEKWLSNWQSNTELNGFSVPHRRNGVEQLILKDWPRGKDGMLDLDEAPFRLLAIGSRLDLRDNVLLSARRIGKGGAGEARFVFCATKRDMDRTPLAFTVIFEYAIKKGDFYAVQDWARQWYGLQDYELGSKQYKEALQRITDQFTVAGADPECPPNLSALSQLRTNEIDLVKFASIQPPAQLVWELREFRVDEANTGLLRPVTVQGTPDLGYNLAPGAPGAPDLDAFLIRELPDLQNRKHQVPVVLPDGRSFMAGSSITPPNFFWSSKAVPSNERHTFSKFTCNGCHAREAFPSVGGPSDPPFDDVADPKQAGRQPPHFTHIRPRLKGYEAQLSAFLTGKEANGTPYFLADPADPLIRRDFHDLSDRAHDLKGLVRYGLLHEQHKIPTQRVH